VSTTALFATIDHPLPSRSGHHQEARPG